MDAIKGVGWSFLLVDSRLRGCLCSDDVIPSVAEFAMFVIARIYECTPPPCPHSWSNNFLFIAPPAGIFFLPLLSSPPGPSWAAKNLFATCNRWVGGEPGGNRTTIFGPAIKSWEVRHCLTWFLLFQASHSRKIPDRKGRRQNGGQFRPDVWKPPHPPAALSLSLRLEGLVSRGP